MPSSLFFTVSSRAVGANLSSWISRMKDLSAARSEDWLALVMCRMSAKLSMWSPLTMSPTSFLAALKSTRNLSGIWALTLLRSLPKIHPSCCSACSLHCPSAQVFIKAAGFNCHSAVGSLTCIFRVKVQKVTWER